MRTGMASWPGLEQAGTGAGAGQGRAGTGTGAGAWHIEKMLRWCSLPFIEVPAECRFSDVMRSYKLLSHTPLPQSSLLPLQTSSPKGNIYVLITLSLNKPKSRVKWICSCCPGPLMWGILWESLSLGVGETLAGYSILIIKYWHWYLFLFF